MFEFLSCKHDPLKNKKLIDATEEEVAQAVEIYLFIATAMLLRKADLLKKRPLQRIAKSDMQLPGTDNAAYQKKLERVRRIKF